MHSNQVAHIGTYALLSDAAGGGLLIECGPFLTTSSHAMPGSAISEVSWSQPRPVQGATTEF